MSSTVGGWAQLRQQARALEQQVRSVPTLAEVVGVRHRAAANEAE